MRVEMQSVALRYYRPRVCLCIFIANKTFRALSRLDTCPADFIRRFGRVPKCVCVCLSAGRDPIGLNVDLTGPISVTV